MVTERSVRNSHDKVYLSSCTNITIDRLVRYMTGWLSGHLYASGDAKVRKSPNARIPVTIHDPVWRQLVLTTSQRRHARDTSQIVAKEQLFFASKHSIGRIQKLKGGLYISLANCSARTQNGPKSQ
jgi:hypothetical protein